MNAYDQKMQMKRENIADRGIWTAKKRYILNVWDSEGVRYKEPKMKIMGLETARSSTPAYFRDKLYAAFKIIIGKTNDELISFINDVRTETRERPYEEVAFPRGCNNLAKYRHPTEIYQKGTPIAVRGALLYNHYVRSTRWRTSILSFKKVRRSSSCISRHQILFTRTPLVSLVICRKSLVWKSMWTIKHNLRSHSSNR